jgi:hypothetical protein
MKEVKLIRLVSGEEVLGDIKAEREGYTVREAYVLIPGGEGKIAFMPFQPYCKVAEQGIHLKEEHVLFITEPVDELAAQIKGQSSVIDTSAAPSTSGIIV